MTPGIDNDTKNLKKSCMEGTVKRFTAGVVFTTLYFLRNLQIGPIS
jgi:hypothetical protein